MNQPPLSVAPATPVLASLSKDSPQIRKLRDAAKGGNVVICVLDAARADHLGCYGYPRPTTPNIDRLARRSLVFEQHFCQFPYTRASTGSLLTSQHPDTHGLLAPTGPGFLALSSSAFTMASGLKQAGWHTAFFSSSVQASPAVGLGMDFEVKHAPGSQGGPLAATTPVAGGEWHLPETILRFLSEWLESKPKRPFLVYVHLLPPHYPYTAPKSMKQLFAGKEPPGLRPEQLRPVKVLETGLSVEHRLPVKDLLNLYDANLRWADWAVGELEGMLRQHGLFDNTLFIVTSDHGEAFGEHGYRGHRSCPYQEAMHVPLLVKLPGPSGPVGRIKALTQTIDLLPTIYDLFTIPYPKEEVQGRSLLPLLAGEVDEVNRYLFARTDGNPPRYLVRDHRWTLILDQDGKRRELYDLDADPGQTRNVIAQEPERAQELTQAFRAFAAAQATASAAAIGSQAGSPSARKAPTIKMTEETRRQLRSLGYVY